MLSEHLGGFIPGGDEATWFPELWDWAIERFEVRSVLDIGCGEGWSTRYFAAKGVRTVGIEGTPQDDPLIEVHDFTTGEWPTDWGVGLTCDLAWSCEFVEHVEERFLPNLMATFKRARVVMMTHAFPGQGGHHHVNCRDPEYWKGAFAAIGFRNVADLTYEARAIAAQNTNPWNHFVRSGLVFERC